MYPVLEYIFDILIFYASIVAVVVVVEKLENVVYLPLQGQQV